TGEQGDRTCCAISDWLIEQWTVRSAACSAWLACERGSYENAGCVGIRLAPPTGGTMLKLYGFPLSNYYNRVKIALLEKNVPFEEVLAVPGKDEVVRTHSPARKIPFIEVEGEFLAESTAI